MLKDEPTYSNRDITEALTLCQGRVYRAADLLGCSARTIYNRIKSDPEIADLHAQLNGIRLDLAEDKLDAAVEAGDAWAICFLLKTIGRPRGYSEKDAPLGALKIIVSLPPAMQPEVAVTDNAIPDVDASPDTTEDPS